MSRTKLGPCHPQVIAIAACHAVWPLMNVECTTRKEDKKTKNLLFCANPYTVAISWGFICFSCCAIVLHNTHYAEKSRDREKKMS